jgi:hypothetical protein
MKRNEIIEILRKCRDNPDFEVAHIEADEALLWYINDEEISDLFYDFKKWYA